MYCTFFAYTFGFKKILLDTRGADICVSKVLPFKQGGKIFQHTRDDGKLLRFQELTNPKEHKYFLKDNTF